MKCGTKPSDSRFEQDLTGGALGDYAEKDGVLGVVFSLVQVVPKEGEPEMRVPTNVPPVVGCQILKAVAEQMEDE